MKTAIIAMSGGVDSSVSAKLLSDQGFSLIGVYMRLGKNYQSGERAARAVCRKLEIRFYPLNLSDRFNEQVVEYFIESYRNGLTPNPCVRCNEILKFGELLRLKNELGVDYLATGHYARVKKDKEKQGNERMILLRGKDMSKDQSYFLYRLKSEDLSRIIFPLGGFTKDEIKKIALKNKLPNLKTESQDVCFLNEDGKIIEHNEFLKKHILSRPGPIMTLDKQIIGKHEGLYLYTRGQRRGIEIGGTGPYYALKADFKKNILYVSNKRDEPVLYSDSFLLQDANWIESDLDFPLDCETVIRYRHKGVPCRVFKNSKNEFTVKLSESERAIASGQSAVFYRKNRVLGGGVILVQ